MKRCSGSGSRRNCARKDSPVRRARRSCCHLVSMPDHVKAEPRHNTTTITLPGRSACPKMYKIPPAASTTFIPNPPCLAAQNSQHHLYNFAQPSQTLVWVFSEEFMIFRHPQEKRGFFGSNSW